MQGNWGVIKNESNKTFFYTLHHEPQSTLEASIIKQRGLQFLDMISMKPMRNDEAQNKYFREMADKDQNTYIVGPQSVSTAGLTNVDLGKIKFISFMMENGRRIPEDPQITEVGDIRIRIRGDTAIIKLKKQEAEKLRQQGN